MKNLTEAQKILFEVALDTETYETEYDGRMYHHCRHCDANIGDGNEHDDECRIFRAQRALGSTWTAYVQEQERLAQEARREAEREAERQRKRDEQERRKREKIECDKCGTRMGMKDHQQSSRCERKQTDRELRDHEERTGIKCITDPYVNYTGKRCLQCNKAMPDAHVNAKFCSNKGQGNCKDRYHNMSSERVERAREYSGQNAAEREARRPSLIDLINEKSAMEGWDEHKDYLF